MAERYENVETLKINPSRETIDITTEMLHNSNMIKPDGTVVNIAKKLCEIEEKINNTVNTINNTVNTIKDITKVIYDGTVYDVKVNECEVTTDTGGNIGGTLVGALTGKRIVLLYVMTSLYPQGADDGIEVNDDTNYFAMPWNGTAQLGVVANVNKSWKLSGYHDAHKDTMIGRALCWYFAVDAT